MYFINTLDEKGRFSGLKFDSTRTGQADSHTYSYLLFRKIHQEDLEEIMGFDREDLYNEGGYVTPTHKRSELDK
jgi:hypothetical protein